MLPVCITIDLDSLYCYQGIYGLPADEDDNLIYEVGLERFANLMEEYGLRGTLFVVGRDLQIGDNPRILRYLAERGFEIASHTQNHDYNLIRLTGEHLQNEVSDGKARLEDAVGREVVGFRAPGYNMSERLLDALERAGHVYDSSVFPCTPYYFTKAAVLTRMMLSGRHSHSILGGPQVLRAPRVPYHPARQAYWKSGNRSILELPISTSPVFRFPFLGSFIILMGETRFPLLYGMLKGSPCLVLEFHGMDFIDGRRDGLDRALWKQPDIAVSWETKEALYRRLFETLKSQREVMTLAEAASLITEANGG